MLLTDFSDSDWKPVVVNTELVSVYRYSFWTWMYTGVPKTALTMTDFICVSTQCSYSQEAQLPQRNIASATRFSRLVN